MVVCVCERRVWLKTQRFGCVNVCEKQSLAKVTKVGLLDVCVCVCLGPGWSPVSAPAAETELIEY